MRDLEIFESWLKQEFPTHVLTKTHDAIVIWEPSRKLGIDFQFLSGGELRYTKLYKDTWDEWQHTTLADPEFFMKTGEMIREHISVGTLWRRG